MKKLNLMISLEGLQFAEQDKAKTPQEIFADAVDQVVLGYTSQKQGLAEKERRQYYKIADALEAAVKTSAEDVELEDDWFGFLKTCFREGKLIPLKVIRRIEEKIAEVPER